MFDLFLPLYTSNCPIIIMTLSHFNDKKTVCLFASSMVNLTNLGVNAAVGCRENICTMIHGAGILTDISN